MKKFTLSLFVENKPGVLGKVSMLIRRKLYNIESLTAHEGRKQGVSRMTLAINTETEKEIEDIIVQINKIPEVIFIKRLEDVSSVNAEVGLFKCTLPSHTIKSLAQRFNLAVVDENSNVIVRVVGTVDDLNNFQAEVGKINILEIARSGVTSMEK